MTTLQLTTIINADKKTVFDLSRNIDLHQDSMKTSGEKTIAGKTSGLIGLNETVTFKGRHFGFPLTHQSKITEMTFYESFTDEMLQGQFKSFRHTHLFSEANGQTMMKDEIIYDVPFGILGNFLNRLFGQKYLTGLITQRNAYIKALAEKQD
ncbi:SRPBCC family protein [Flavobacterium enshiense]|uniref:SRPBCC family protein n=1 Tax=Flavobacterium enshiense TaxID=1341165 RepID=UPI00345D548B